MKRSEELWYCVDCKGWGGKVVNESTPPRCQPSHRIIKVRDNGGVGIPTEIKRPDDKVKVVFT